MGKKRYGEGEGEREKGKGKGKGKREKGKGKREKGKGKFAKNFFWISDFVPNREKRDVVMQRYLSNLKMT